MARKDFNFHKVIRNISSDPTFPRLLGSIAVNHFKQSFRDGGFTDKSLISWQRRKVNRPGATLVKTGALRRSIKIKYATFRKIVVGTSGIPYAQIHNEGLDGKAFGRHKFKMPKRQFIGESEILERKLKKGIINHIIKSFKNGS